VSFKIGDKVIYPNHGLGIVAKIEEKTIFGNTEGFFLLRILSTESTVLVPVANVDNVGLRRAISDEEVEELYRLLGDGHIDNHQNWKGRFKDNSDKMRTGSIYDMADVLKSLTFLAKSKSLSFREKRMLDRAKSLIVSEISEVMRIRPEAVEARVNEQLEKCFAERARAVAAGEPLPPPRIIPPAPPRSAMPLPAVKPMAAPAAPRPVTPVQTRVVEKSPSVATPAQARRPAAVPAAKPAGRAASGKAPAASAGKAPAASKKAAPAKPAVKKAPAKPAAKKVAAKPSAAKKVVARTSAATNAKRASTRAASKKAAPKKGAVTQVKKTAAKKAPAAKAAAAKQSRGASKTRGGASASRR
jgi:CarD family transcriptional regulator